jgi:hypothetical protein
MTSPANRISIPAAWISPSTRVRRGRTRMSCTQKPLAHTSVVDQQLSFTATS